MCVTCSSSSRNVALATSSQQSTNLQLCTIRSQFTIDHLEPVVSLFKKTYCGGTISAAAAAAAGVCRHARSGT
jgi:hypothetical protein